MAFLDKKHLKKDLFEIVGYLFQSLLIAYLALLLIEQVWQGSVSYYINLNYLLVIVIALGIVDVFSEHKEKKKEELTLKNHIFIIVLSILGFVLIKYKTGELGWLSWVISSIASLLIYLVSLLVYDDEEDEELVWKLSPKKTIMLVAGILLLASIGLSFSSLSLFESLRIIFGSVYVLFLPGFALSFVFFEKGKIEWLERIALSFGLSIAVVPLVVFYLNLIGLRISFLSVFFTVLGVILVSFGIIFFRNKRTRK